MLRRKVRGASGGFTLIEIMVVMGLIAGLVGMVALVVPQMMEKGKQTTCRNNLRQLGNTYQGYAIDISKPVRPPHSGVAMWLYYRTVKNDIREGAEAVLFCPGDPSAQVPTGPDASARYDDIDLRNPPHDLCSFAARDFLNYPIRPGAKSIQIIGCDRNGLDGRTLHHEDGVNIVFDDSSVAYYDREMLGISRGADVVVGPDSDQALLKQVIYAPHGQQGTKE
jgi:prepilin-type N-terminal cleavage/methylation domain-containing protein